MFDEPLFWEYNYTTRRSERFETRVLEVNWWRHISCVIRPFLNATQRTGN